MDQDLAEALMDMVNQHCPERRDSTFWGGCISSNDDALSLLCDIGLAEPSGQGFRLLWDKLEVYGTVSRARGTVE